MRIDKDVLKVLNEHYVTDTVLSLCKTVRDDLNTFCDDETLTVEQVCSMLSKYAKEIAKLNQFAKQDQAEIKEKVLYYYIDTVYPQLTEKHTELKNLTYLSGPRETDAFEYLCQEAGIQDANNDIFPQVAKPIDGATAGIIMIARNYNTVEYYLFKGAEQVKDCKIVPTPFLTVTDLEKPVDIQEIVSAAKKAVDNYNATEGNMDPISF